MPSLWVLLSKGVTLADKVGDSKKTAGALRVYEYVDHDGIVFWSFAKLAQISTRRMTLDDVRGTHFRTHISDVQRMAFQADILDEE